MKPKAGDYRNGPTPADDDLALPVAKIIAAALPRIAQERYPEYVLRDILIDALRVTGVAIVEAEKWFLGK